MSSLLCPRSSSSTCRVYSSPLHLFHPLPSYSDRCACHSSLVSILSSLQSYLSSAKPLRNAHSRRRESKRKSDFSARSIHPLRALGFERGSGNSLSLASLFSAASRRSSITSTLSRPPPPSPALSHPLHALALICYKQTPQTRSTPPQHDCSSRTSPRDLISARTSSTEARGRWQRQGRQSATRARQDRRGGQGRSRGEEARRRSSPGASLVFPSVESLVRPHLRAR